MTMSSERRFAGPSNSEALMEELKRLNENALAEADKLLAKLATPVEIPALATRK